MPKRIDLTGKQFDSWYVIKYHGIKNKQSYWLCKCTCGKEQIVRGDSLRDKKSTQCSSCASTKHNQSKNPIYRHWLNMHARCYNSNTPNFELWGGKGITVCQEWHDLETFIAWANNNGYKKGLSLDRIDPDKNYQPDNCEWVTREENSRRIHTRGWDKSDKTSSMNRTAEILGDSIDDDLPF